MAKQDTTGRTTDKTTDQTPVRSVQGAVRRAGRAHRRAVWFSEHNRMADAQVALDEAKAYVALAHALGAPKTPTRKATPKAPKAKTTGRRLTGFCASSARGELVGAAKAAHEAKLARIAVTLNEPIRTSVVRPRGNDQAVKHPRERGRVREVATVPTVARLARLGISL